MGYTLRYYYDGMFPIFELHESMSEKEIQDLLRILSSLTDKDSHFVFLVDARKTKKFPRIATARLILKWMKANKKKLPGKLLASSVIFKSKLITEILSWVFERQKPVSPNKITNDINIGISFINEHMLKNGHGTNPDSVSKTDE